MIRRAFPLFAVALVLTSTAGAVALLPAGTAAKPTEGRENIFPTWSPDGTRIAFASSSVASNDNDIWFMRADGTGLFNLTPDALNEESHSWSPDGTRLAITSAPVDGSATPSVEVIDADGGGRRVLATGSLPAWSPDGTRIAYDGEGGFHVVEVVDGNDRLVAPVVPGFAYRPSWSPDGRRIAYVFESNVWAVDFDGSDRQRLTSFTDGRFATAPVWSPDGHRIACVRDSEVWAVEADGSDTRRLASFTVARIAAAPTWSPDGSRIAFLVVGPTSAPAPNDVWTVGDDGTGLRRVMSAPFVDGVAHWAPDGRSLVFAASRRRDHDVELYRAIMPDGPVLNLSNDRAWNQMPRFAPDGGRLAFVVRHSGGYLLSDVWTLDLDTGRRRNLTGTASGEAIDARAVRPPNRLTLARVAAWLDRSFPRPILRVEVRVSDRARDEVRGAVVSITLRLRGLEPLSDDVLVTDGHGDTQTAFRVRRPGAVHVGSRIRVTVSARPRAPYARRIAVSRELQLRVAARPPLG